jgi:hypothetical protein
MPPVDADSQRQRPGSVEHEASHPQHPLLVVVGTAGGSGGQHDLAAVTVDVGLEEGDVMISTGVLHVADCVVEGLGQRARAV